MDEGTTSAAVGAAEIRTVPPGGIPIWTDADPSHPPLEQLDAGCELVVVGRRGSWVHVETRDGLEGWVDGAQLAGGSPESHADVVDKARASFSLGRGPMLGALGALVAIFGTALPWQQTVALRVEVDAYGLPVRMLTGWEHLGDRGLALGWLVVILASVAAVVSLVAGGGIVRRVLGFAIVLVCIVYVLQQQDWLTSLDRGVGTGFNVWDVVDYGVLVTFGGGLLMTLAPSR